MVTPKDFLENSYIKHQIYNNEYYILKDINTNRLIGQLSLDFSKLDIYSTILCLSKEEQEYLKLRLL